MRIVVAPDKFKGTLSAPEAAAAMAAGVRRRDPSAEVVEIPLADGGEGTIDAICSARSARIERCRARDPLGRPLDAKFALLDDGRAMIESAEVGLGRVDPGERDALRASSAGVGDLVGRAIELGAREVLVGIGGSAWTDGGTGMATALGWRFGAPDGSELPPGGGSLRDVAWAEPPPSPTTGPVLGLYDVDHHLLGDRGAARVFAPQKGAGRPEVEVLEAGLTKLATLLPAAAGVAGAGAGGGLGYGIVTFLGGRLAPGFDTIADLVGLDDQLRDADLVITGEGRLDAGSLGGKVPVGVARRARRAAVPCAVIAGEVAVAADTLRAAGIARWVALVDTFGERAHCEPVPVVAAAAASLIG